MASSHLANVTAAAPQCPRVYPFHYWCKCSPVVTQKVCHFGETHIHLKTSSELIGCFLSSSPRHPWGFISATPNRKPGSKWARPAATRDRWEQGKNGQWRTQEQQTSQGSVNGQQRVISAGQEQVNEYTSFVWENNADERRKKPQSAPH